MPTAGVRRRRRIPLVWIVPLLTGLIAAWLAYDTYSKRGPTIVISFETAAGLTAGQSQLQYKNVVVGTVRSIDVSSDLTKVLITVDTVREAEPLLTDKTIFWVVKPELFAGNIPGLETLLSGSYIGMRPAADRGAAKRDFVGEEDPPVLQAWTKGTVFKLNSKRLGSLSLGSPIFYRDLEVGTVLGWDIGDLASKITVHAFVRAPYDKYVRDDTSFWNASSATPKPSALTTLRSPCRPMIRACCTIAATRIMRWARSPRRRRTFAAHCTWLRISPRPIWRWRRAFS